MVYRVYVEKKSGHDLAARQLSEELRSLLGVYFESLRILNRYDVEGIDEDLFKRAVTGVFSEPPVDETFDHLETGEGDIVFAVEYLPGQFDQRADSAAECIKLISKGDKPIVRNARVYVLNGSFSEEELDSIKKYLINPVEAREAELGEYDTLAEEYDEPEDVKIITDFIDFSDEELESLSEDMGLAMDIEDLKFVRDHFLQEERDPSVTEIRVIDTYWSDHCRHTTFNTTIDDITFDDPVIEKTYEDYIAVRDELGRKKPVSLMDMGTIAAKYLKSKGMLDKLDESEEINACTVNIKVDVDGKDEDWLLFFKNETHNHPTEIEPFGGAATCIGGAIRDPLSGRSYVYQAMRLTGAGDPLTPISETLKGKLPQSKIVTEAAKGYSSYGNQIGLATGLVDEVYHPGFVAKRMEVGAVVAASRKENVIRKRPIPGDVVILLGGRTGRDGMGGATGSSKSHTEESLSECGAEVQKGNAPEERKLQRLFRNPEASKMIKRCNDFGAGGVSVAIGELADGLEIDLDKVPKKYEGLDGTELAISESQERMAVVVSNEDSKRFIELSEAENLEATIVAHVTKEPYLREYWRGNRIVDISRSFLDTNGTEKHIKAEVEPQEDFSVNITGSFRKDYLNTVSSLNVASKRGLSEMFDSTIGAGTVLMPFGGKYQKTPPESMVSLIPLEKGKTDTVSVMAYGYDPFISEKSPYKGAYLAVVSSVAKLIATGAPFKDIYLSFQEYFERLGVDEKRWGKPVSAVLGAFRAQKELGVAAIGGKDSMSGTFEHIDVPPTLISFAITTASSGSIISPEFKGIYNKVIMYTPKYGPDGLPSGESLKALFNHISDIASSGHALSIYTPCQGGISEAVYKMCAGNGIGFRFDHDMKEEELFVRSYGSFIVETDEKYAKLSDNTDFNSFVLGMTTRESSISLHDSTVSLDELGLMYERKLEPVYRTKAFVSHDSKPETINYKGGEQHEYSGPALPSARPKVLLTVFPGTNCEYDTARAFEEAGADVDIAIINNMDSEHVSRSVEDVAAKIRSSQILFIPGGFSAGDEPDGSGKFITCFFRNPEVRDATNALIKSRDGLMAGICNGFQALIKLGLVPYGEIREQEEDSPTLTFNDIGRHQSKLIRIRIASTKSPWLQGVREGDIYTMPISHGEGKFIADEDKLRELIENGQIITQYVDLDGEPTYDIDYNPNGSVLAVEGITSPDGRVLGKMGHAERIGESLYKNVPGEYDMKLFESAVKYFR